MSPLEGKTVVVTGASKGIGAAIAAAVGRDGAHLVAHYGTDRGGAERATQATPADRVKLIGCDFNDPANGEQFWQEALAWRNRIDVLVCNAAVMRLDGGIEDETEAWDQTWDEAMRVNVLAPARLMRLAVRQFLQQGGGTLIGLSSWAANRGVSNPDAIAYAASKAAISAAVKTIARGYAKRNVLAYLVAPGVVRTQMSVDSAATLGGEAAVSAGLAMGEWVPPAEIGELVAFLATGRCRHLTGATLDVNGASYLR